MKKLTILLLALLLPMISLAQSADKCYRKGKEFYDRREYKQALEWFKKAANQGNATAQYYLGEMYDTGYYGVTQDYTKAVEWYQKAANQGNTTAQVRLGYIHKNGNGVTQDYVKAVEWYQKAANQGDAYAQNNLGLMYENGNGVTKDYTKALEWYQKAANQGNASAKTNLTNLQKKMARENNALAQESISRTESAEECCIKGYEYYNKKDYKNAFELFQKAADQGNANAQNCLGVMYRNGYGVTKDDAKAVEWYQKAANQGDATAQNNLGHMYHDGYGVPKDDAKALEWYQKAADQGNLNAQTSLGYMYHNGYGVPKDDAKAVEWYQQAANQGDARAQSNLGMSYRDGTGVPKDYAKAMEWFQQAANQGYEIAQTCLGVMYENGNGVPKDYAKAVEWYQKAANQGNERAKTNLANLQKKMADEKNTLAQTTNTSTQKPTEKPKEQPKTQVQSQPKPQPQPKVGLALVDTDIPVINRVNENTFAIIIANEDYQDETKVDYAKNDGEVFKNYCHKTLGLPQKNVHLVVNATRNNIVGELYWLSKVCKAYKGDASIIFYYAGHGLPDEDSGSAYLLPVDGKSELLPTCYSINELYETLGSLPTKRVTVLMDACFSGAKRNGGMLASARGVAIKAKAAAPKGSMIVLSAAQGNETAYKYEDAKHGLFTYFLLKKLKDTKGSVTMGELSDYIQDQVGRYSIVENGKSQTPSIMASDNLRNSWKGLMF